MPLRKPEHKGVVDAIIDEQLDAQKLVEEAERKAPDVAGRMMVVARRLVALGKQRKVDGQQAKKLWVEAWKAVHLAAFASQAGAIQEHVDKHLAKQLTETKKLKRPLRELSPIRELDIKAREMERAGAVDDEGRLKT